MRLLGYWVIAPDYTGSEMRMLYAPENQKSPATECQTFTAYFLPQWCQEELFVINMKKHFLILFAQRMAESVFFIS